jgi:hypothetical protein
MTARTLRVSLALVATLALGAAAGLAQSPHDWPVHDLERPQPRIVTPGTFGTQETPGTPPSDAIVLFDGTDLSAFKSARTGGPATWKVENGYVEVVDKAGYIETRQAFGDVQLHVEFRTPTPPKDKSQGRGNSGIFFMGRYEVQVLDSYENETYPDGQAAAAYGQYPPLVNASRPPGTWQVYDIVFEAPRFDAQGVAVKPARVTVFHNGILVQHATELTGPTAHKRRPPYEAHPAKLPLRIQDHSNPVRFRNIWVRELEPRAGESGN